MARNITVKNEKKLKQYLRKVAKKNDTQSDHKKNQRNKSGSSTA